MSKHKFEEKSVVEKWQRDLLSPIVWTLILIWAGFVSVASNLGMLDALNGIIAQIGFEFAELPVPLPLVQLSSWSLIFLGAGILLLAEVVIRLLLPTYRRPVMITVILAVFLLTGSTGRWALAYILALIAGGLVVLLGGLFKRK